MNEKTKKILKVSAIALGEMALLTLGFAVGACSAKAGTKQQTAITTPVAKSLIQRPKKATAEDIIGTWQPNSSGYIDPGNYLGTTIRCPFSYNGVDYTGFQIFRSGGADDMRENAFSFPSKPKKVTGIPTAYTVYYSGTPNLLAYDSNRDWVESGNIIISSIEGVSDTNNLYEFLQIYYTKYVEPEPDPEPIPLPETYEKVVLNSSYDFRRWFGNVDPTTGAIQYKLPTGASLVSVRVGGLTWENLGNERVYNCIEFTLQPFNSSNALVVSDGLAKTAQQLYGDKYNEFCMLSGVYYSYQSGYDGTYTTITDSALPSVDYRDRIYSMPMVSAQLDGTTENINALDIRNCVIPSVYRTFVISQDDGVVFSTNGYSSVTMRQLLGMDFSSVVNYSEGTASAFSLLTQAFGSVAGLLAVQVLPNITLGLLIFLPLIGAVIVLVIKAVKK